jgi:hypothetical protein
MASKKNTIREKIRHFILHEKIPLPAWLYYWMLKRLSKCKTCLDGICFPIYGTCPKEKKENWPDNYDDVDRGCGVYYCPEKNCKYSKEKQHKQLYRLYNNPERLNNGRYE